MFQRERVKGWKIAMSFRRAGQSSSTDKNADKDAAAFLWCNEISLNNDVCDAHTTRKKKNVLQTKAPLHCGFNFYFYLLSTHSLRCVYLLHIKKVLGNHFVVFIILYRKNKNSLSRLTTRICTATTNIYLSRKKIEWRKSSSACSFPFDNLIHLIGDFRLNYPSTFTVSPDRANYQSMEIAYYELFRPLTLKRGTSPHLLPFYYD